ncbi:MAG: glycosyltransferase family 2 protein [Bacilli bacterium]|nr:glycosyltransferase family 2 protein [Bacilli bacterium]
MLDVIIPTFNEEDNIEPLYKELSNTLKDIKYNLIFIDDGSTDKTLSNLIKVYKKDTNHIKIISFTRNFGKDAAIYAGLKESTGKYISIIDSDLQQHPKHILEMIDFLNKNEDYDEVAMVNSYTNESFIQKKMKKSFYKLMTRITHYNFEVGASDFRTIRNYVAKTLIDLKETNRFTKGLFAWTGFNVKYLKYTPDKRLHGKSKFNFRKQINYAIDGILNFSTSPMKLALYLGSTISIFSFIYLVYLIIKTLILGKDIPGFASIMCVLLLLGGVILTLLGLIGEYVARIYMETKQRPIYISKIKFGFDDNIL